MSKQTLTTLSLVQRVEVIRLLDPNEMQVSLADKFKVGQAVISRIKRDKEKILNDCQKNFIPGRKRKRTGQATIMFKKRYYGGLAKQEAISSP